LSNVIKIDFVNKKKKVEFSLDHLITENVNKKFSYIRSKFIEDFIANLDSIGVQAVTVDRNTKVCWIMPDHTSINVLTIESCSNVILLPKLSINMVDYNLKTASNKLGLKRGNRLVNPEKGKKFDSWELVATPLEILDFSVWLVQAFKSRIKGEDIIPEVPHELDESDIKRTKRVTELLLYLTKKEKDE